MILQSQLEQQSGLYNRKIKIKIAESIVQQKLTFTATT